MAEALKLTPREDDIFSLRSFALFASIDYQHIKAISDSGELVAYARGENIETPPHHISLLIDGTIRCVLIDAAEKKCLLGTEEPGNAIGELAYLLPERTSHDEKVHMFAERPVRLLHIPSPIFAAAVFSNEAAAKELARIQARRLSYMNTFAKRAIDLESNPSKVRAVTFGQRFADSLTQIIGSWTFLSGMIIFVVMWSVINIIMYAFGYTAWDEYPHIFLNLVLSTLGALTMSVVLISQNRQSQIDRDAAHASRKMISKLYRKMVSFMAAQRSMRDDLNELKKKIDSQKQ